MNHGGFEQTALIISKGDGRSSIRLFTAEPTPLEERNLGTLFAICEIDSNEASNEQLLDVFIDEITHAYYASESFEVESAFEHALHKLNQKIAEVVGEIGEDWLKTCNMVFGVYKGRELVFTHIGRVIGMLFAKDQMVEIIDSGSRIQELNPMKFFSNIVAGEIPERSRVLLATESMMDYLSRETVRRIMTAKNEAEAVTELTELLSVDTGDRNFIGYIFKPNSMLVDAGVPAEAATVPNAVQATTRTHDAQTHAGAQGHASVDSMSSLMNREQQTAELLTSSLWPGLKKGLKDAMSNLRSRKDTDDEDTQPFASFQEEPVNTRAEEAPVVNRVQRMDGTSQRNTKHTLQVVAQHTGKGLAIVGSALAAAGAWVWMQLRHAIAIARGKRNAGNSNTYGGRRGASMNMSSVKQGLGNIAGGIVQWFIRLSNAQKIFVVVALVVFVIFAQSVFTRGSDSGSGSGSADDYSQIISQVDVKINEGKAAELISGDSRAKYLEARDLLGQVPKDSKIYKQRGEELERVISEELKKTNKVKELGSLSPVLDFGSIASGLQVKQMVLLGASVYAFDANNGSVYRGNLENNGVTVALSNTAGSARIVAASKASPGTSMVVQSGNAVGTFNPLSEAIASAALSFGTPAQNIVDVSVFGTRVYTLDAGTNQIVRNKKEGENYVGGENWLTDSSADIRNAVGMAIDGSIYVLGNNGVVQKFDSGSRNNTFTLTGVEPALDSGVAIATDENTANIYVGDAKNKRVVVFGKDGSLVQQYTSDSFDGMVDVIADEANKRMFVLTQNGKVFKIDL